MENPTKLMFAGDWHMNSHWAMLCVEFASRNGVSHILHTGDYGYTFSSNFRASVEKVCAEHGVMIYFVDGNHDNHPWLWKLPVDEDGFFIVSEHVRCVPRGHVWEWFGLRFIGLGGATSVDKQWRNPFTEWWPTETIKYWDAQKAIDNSPCDVLVTHDCPSGVPIPGISLENGVRNGFPHEALMLAEEHRRFLRTIVDQVSPKLLVHGHFHTNYRFYDSVSEFNVQGLDMDATDFDLNLLTFDESLFVPFE